MVAVWFVGAAAEGSAKMTTVAGPDCISMIAIFMPESTATYWRPSPVR